MWPVTGFFHWRDVFRFTYLVANIRASFLFPAEKQSMVWVHPVHCVYPRLFTFTFH